MKHGYKVKVLILCFSVSMLLSCAHPPVQKEDGPSTFMWEIRPIARPTSATVYILGSMHLAPDSIFPLNPKIESAFQQSSNVAVEVDIGRNAILTQVKLVWKAMYHDGTRLKDHVSVETYAGAAKAMEKHGVSIETLGRFKPWFIAVTIELLEAASQGYDPENGIETYFLNKARGTKQILELESASEQIRLLDESLADHQDAFLASCLAPKKLDPLLAAWRTGNAAQLEAVAFEELGNGPEAAPILETFVFARNIKMAGRIEGYLHTGGTYFVMVGAAHLVGNKGIISLLQSGKKYTIRQL